MKLQLMFLLMDILMLLACGYLWLKTFFLRARCGSLELPNHELTEIVNDNAKEKA